MVIFLQKINLILKIPLIQQKQQLLLPPLIEKQVSATEDIVIPENIKGITKVKLVQMALLKKQQETSVLVKVIIRRMVVLQKMERR